MKSNFRHSNLSKWTTEVVTQHLHTIENEMSNGEYLFLSSVLVRMGLYRRLWKSWKELFRNDGSIKTRMAMIEEGFKQKQWKEIAQSKISKSWSYLDRKTTFK